MNNKFVPLNEKIRYLRLLRSKTQSEVAEALSITRSCLSNYESGIREPDFQMIKDMAEYFGVETSYFFNNGKVTSALSEADKEEYTKLVSKIRKVNSTINTAGMSLSSQIALHSFYEYLEFCDMRYKKKRGKNEYDDKEE